MQTNNDQNPAPNAYELKLDARRERLEQRAEKARKESERRFGAASERASYITPGQPILVGHHSERRHRRDLERIENDMRRGVEESKKADRLEERAAAVGTGGISLDDPDSTRKLEAELANCLSAWETAKAVNAAWRKAKRPKADENLEFWKALEERFGAEIAKGAHRTIRYSVTAEGEVYSWVQPYSLSSYSAEAKRIKLRIAESKRLEKLQEQGEQVTEYSDGTIYRFCPDDNRVRLEFPGKPDPERRQQMKQAGMRWAPSVGAWQTTIAQRRKVLALIAEWGLESGF